MIVPELNTHLPRVRGCSRYSTPSRQVMSDDVRLRTISSPNQRPKRKPSGRSRVHPPNLNRAPWPMTRGDSRKTPATKSSLQGPPTLHDGLEFLDLGSNGRDRINRRALRQDTGDFIVQLSADAVAFILPHLQEFTVLREGQIVLNLERLLFKVQQVTQEDNSTVLTAAMSPPQEKTCKNVEVVHTPCADQQRLEHNSHGAAIKDTSSPVRRPVAEHH